MKFCGYLRIYFRMTKSSILLKYQQKDDSGIARFASAIVPVDSVEVTLKRVLPGEAGQEVPGYGLVLILPLQGNTVKCGTAVYRIDP
jgi:hypothetical protein